MIGDGGLVCVCFFHVFLKVFLVGPPRKLSLLTLLQ